MANSRKYKSDSFAVLYRYCNSKNYALLPTFLCHDIYKNLREIFHGIKLRGLIQIEQNDGNISQGWRIKLKITREALFTCSHY